MEKSPKINSQEMLLAFKHITRLIIRK